MRSFPALILVLALLLATAAALLPRMPLPAADSLQYLRYARTLLLTGQYADSTDGPAADHAPGREPLYSALIAAVARLDPTLQTVLVGCDPPAARCLSGFRRLLLLNALMLATAALLAALTVGRLGGGRLAAAVAAGYVACNSPLWKDMRFVLSDYLAVLLVAAVTLTLVGVTLRPRALRRWCAAGLALALLGLTKAIFIPFGLLVGLLAMLAAWRGRQDGRVGVLPGALALLAVIILVDGGWAARNLAWFGAATDGRAGIALSTREVFDHMTPAENRAAFLWWWRGPGPGLARRWLAADAWQRYQWDDPNGFYHQGQVVRPAQRIERLTREQGLSYREAERRSTDLVLAEIAADWRGYLWSMPAVFYRGLGFDDYAVIGFPLLLLSLRHALRTRRCSLLAALAPGLWSLCLYPVISLNIPRYQYTAVIAVAVAAGLGAERLAARLNAASRWGSAAAKWR